MILYFLFEIFTLLFFVRTFTLQDKEFAPTLALTVVEPLALPYKMPSSSTVATLELLEVHFTFELEVLLY